MNSTVRLIFNEKVVKKLNLWVRKQCTSRETLNISTKKKTAKMQNVHLESADTLPKRFALFKHTLSYFNTISLR